MKTVVLKCVWTRNSTTFFLT